MAGRPDDDGWAEGAEVALFSAVASPAAVDQDVVLAVVRAAVAQVVAGTVGVELTWTSVAITDADDLASADPDLGRDGLDWSFLAGRHHVRSVTVSAAATALLDHPRHPKHTPASVYAARSASGWTVGVSVQRWAMYGGGADLTFAVPVVERWVLESARALAATTGFVTLDRIDASAGESPWERATACMPSARDTRRTLWGYGWGTLLSPAHLDLVGTDRLMTVADVRSAQGRVWATLGADPAVDPARIAALREVLLPALPRGSRSLAEFLAEVESGHTMERYVL